jgi:subtilisin family serine protease
MVLSRRARPLLPGSLAICIAAALQIAALESQSAAARTQRTGTVDGHEVVAGEVLVQFDSAGAALANHRMLAQQVDVDDDVPVGRRGLRRFRSRRRDVESLLAFFRAQPGVAFAEPNYILRSLATPNDPQFTSLWGLLNIGQTIIKTVGTPGADIDATSAWDVSTGSRAVVVGVIDSGIDYTHEDLAANVWSAPAPFTVTIGGVVISCPAGSHGFDAITRTCDPMDPYGHGTHVAGTIGALGNNGVGVTGVNWASSIIAARFLDQGVGTTANAIDSIDFMVQAKAAFASTGGADIRVLNNSWGGGAASTALQNAIMTAHANEMLFVAAAGNSGTNTDLVPHYPASYDLPSIVSVAATDNRDRLASFSNFGATTVHLSAPGAWVLSTTPGNRYAFLNGTSFAAPHVSGAAALVLSSCTLDTAALKNALLFNVDVLGSLAGRVSTAGRLNVSRAIHSCRPAGPPSAPTGVSATAGASHVSLTWSPAPGAVTYNVKRSTTNGGPYATIATGVGTPAYIDTNVSVGVTYYYVVSAVNSAGESPDSAQVSATPLLSAPAPPGNLKASPGDGRVSLTWLPATGAKTYLVTRSLLRVGPYSTIAEVPGTAYDDLAVTNGSRYFYAVRAVNAAGESGNSNRVSATPAPVPAPPTGVTAVIANVPGAIILSWNTSTWATAYKVKRRTTNGSRHGSIATVTTSSFTDSGRTSGRTYFYVITAVNASGESGPSIAVSVTAR